MFASCIHLLFLRPCTFESLAFPRWQVVLAHSVLWLALVLPGILFGRPLHWSDLIAMQSVSAVAVAIVMLLVYGTGWVLLVAALRTWLRAGKRWDGRGDLFKLLAAASLPGALLMLVNERLAEPWPWLQIAVRAILLCHVARALVHAMTRAIPGLGPVYAATGLGLASLVGLTGTTISFSIFICLAVVWGGF